MTKERAAREFFVTKIIPGYLILLVATCFILEACDEAPAARSKYGMDCTTYLNSEHSIYRCENEEAICYNHDDHLFCKFKQ